MTVWGLTLRQPAAKLMAVQVIAMAVETLLATERVTPLEEKMIRLANERRIEEYLDVMLEHPEYGKLMRVLAQEEGAPEHEEFLRRHSTTDGAGGV